MIKSSAIVIALAFFAMAKPIKAQEQVPKFEAGGGIDFNVSRRVFVRPLQAECFMTRLNNRQNNLRIGAGIVIRLGRE